jgi:hypothetical protein
MNCMIKPRVTKNSIESWGVCGGFWGCPLSPSKPVIAFWRLRGQIKKIDLKMYKLSNYRVYDG